MEGAVTEVAQETTFETAAGPDVLARPGFRRVIVVIGLLAAVLFRLFLIFEPLGELDVDEAVSGLMARHILQGELPVFYWDQNYGGTGEIFLTAAVFALFDSSTAAVRAVPILLLAATAFVLWRAGRRFFDEPGASVGAVLFLVWPAYFVWKSMLAHGYYGLLVFLGTSALFLALKVREAPSLPLYAALGLTIGLGVWTSPQIVLIAIPIVVWLLAQGATRGWKELSVMAGAAVAGSAPWWIWNVQHQWSSILDKPVLPTSTYQDHLAGLVTHVIPAGLGLRVSGGDWLLPGWARGVIYAALLSVLTWCVVRAVRAKDPPLLLMILIMLSFPWLYALSPHAWYIDEPRYLLLVLPVICLMVGWGFNRSYAVRLFTVVLTLPLTAVGLRHMNSMAGATPPEALQTRSTDWPSVIEVLRDHDVRFVIADFVLAYPITFETREKIIATSSGRLRYLPHDELVRSQPHPAYVFVTGVEAQTSFDAQRGSVYAGYVPVLQNRYTVYVYEG